MHRIKKLFFDPQPFRTIIKEIVKKFEIGSYRTRFQMGAVERNHYAYCVYNAAILAKRLHYPRISVVEFGVAGGKGLLNLEYHAKAISELFDIEIEIYGFDTGEGLPEPIDYRDLPYHWKEGFFKMDFPSLQKKLKTAKLVIGNISETSKSFFEDFNPAPIGAVMCDVDFILLRLARYKCSKPMKNTSCRACFATLMTLSERKSSYTATSQDNDWLSTSLIKITTK